MKTSVDYDQMAISAGLDLHWLQGRTYMGLAGHRLKQAKNFELEVS